MVEVTDSEKVKASTILFVEHDDNDVFLLRGALHRDGIENPVQVCSDGQEALRYLQGLGEYENREKFPFPGIVFLGGLVEEGDGPKILRWPREHPECYVPILVLSDWREEAVIARAYREGANAYIIKPNSMDELAKIIKSACEFWSVCAKPRVEETC